MAAESLPGPGGDPGAVPAEVRHVLRSPGRSLDAGTRAYLEPRLAGAFGELGLRSGSEREAEAVADRVTAMAAPPAARFDVSRVRVHTDARAAASARALGALAYTMGHDIVFGPGQYRAGTPAGGRLLAHELAHVGQQARFGHKLQRAGDKAQRPQSVSYRIKIPPGISSKEEFRRYAETVIFGRVLNKPWQATPGAAEMYADIARHAGTVVTFQVDASELALFGRADDPAVKAQQQAADAAYRALPAAERQAVNEEIDRRYYATEKIAPGTKIAKGETGKAAIWNSLRQQVMADRRKLDTLPPEVRGFLFDDNAATTLQPRDFEQVLRIASKVSELSPAELAEYKSRAAGQASGWTGFEASLDRFIAERREREATAQQRGTLQTRLVGLEDLYQRYLSYMSMLKSNTVLAGMGAQNPQALGTSLGTLPALNQIRADLQADLVKAGFPGGIADLEKLIRDCGNNFEKETLAFTNVMLDQYAHLLSVQERRYADSKVTDALFDQLNGAGADFEEAERIRSEHATGIVLTPGEMEEQAYWIGKRDEALARGEAKMTSAAAAHPLIAENKFPRERLARAARNEVQPLMLGFIAERRNEIATTRKNLRDTPRMIYGLGGLIEASLQAQNIQKGSLYERIIRKHISDVHWDEAIPDIVLGIIALVAGLFTGGTGTVAVLAGATALGIGAYQALQEFRRYEMRSAAFGAGLTSEDPSMAWVIVAVIGAGIDAAAFASSLPKLRGALEAFNAGTEAGDVAALSRKLDKLAEVDESIRKTIVRAADAEAQARTAWRSVLRPAGLYSYWIPYADVFGKFVFAVYLSLKRGIRELQLFVKSREGLELIGDVAKLPAEQLAALKAGYLKAIEEAEAVAAHGTALGMADNEVLAFMNLRGQTAGMTAEQVMKEMEAWKAVKASGLPFGFESAEQFAAFRATAARGLRKAGYPDAEAILQGSSASGISYEKKLPFGAHSDMDVAVAGRSVFERARRLGYEVKSNPMRIGPLEPDQIKELDLGAMYRELTEAAGEREVNLLLFSNRAAALQGIAGVTPTSIPLK